MAESGILARADGATIAYERTPGRTPGVVFVHGFHSDMGGTKPRALEAHCRAAGRAFLRYDAFGHGASSGRFQDGTISRWRDDLLAVLDALTDGPQVLVGSSMGGWLMLLAARARPGRIGGLLGIAAAPDFTETLMWDKFGPELKNRLADDGLVTVENHYGDEPLVITRNLIEDGRANLLLGGPLPIQAPVRLLHGQADAEVPWPTALALAERLESPDLRVTLVKSGGHRLSEPAEIALLLATLDELVQTVAASARSPSR